ncbi:HNH endonuclease [Oscillibacter hominis]|uniref:HNH endonuclease n=1 Tax=Oscillibacter hominis TaxID=2763056 RepID=A0A7G9B548_9FIRM|nr:HNH endonuclease [Oscillibacter hominis]QNL44679.1 HNH endonuclease [Oscillibacter hominis]
MISAKLTNETRKAVYRRDGYRCALCDSTAGLQVHHVVRRSQGGTDYPHNLITLCWRCHAVAHGTRLPEYGDLQGAEVCQDCVEYLADYYADEGFLWSPWAKVQPRLYGGD